MQRWREKGSRRAGGYMIAPVSSQKWLFHDSRYVILAEPGDILCLCSGKDLKIRRPGIRLIKMTFLCKLSWRVGSSAHTRDLLGPGRCMNNSVCVINTQTHTKSNVCSYCSEVTLPWNPCGRISDAKKTTIIHSSSKRTRQRANYKRHVAFIWESLQYRCLCIVCSVCACVWVQLSKPGERIKQW